MNPKQTESPFVKQRWIVLAASCIANLCIGSLYAWSVFAGPLAQKFTELGTTTAAGDLAIVFSVANSVGPIMLIAGGYINDKLSPRAAIFASGAFFGTGMIIAGNATSMPVLIAGYSVCCGIGMGLGYGCTIGNSVKFFPDKRGLIGGVATASYGLSSVVVPPIANAMIASWGVSSTFVALGATFAVLVCAASFFVIKAPDNMSELLRNNAIENEAPSSAKGTASLSHGESRTKHGDTSNPTASAPPTQTATALPDKNGTPDRTWQQMLASPLFYLMFCMLACGAISGMTVISQASLIAQNMAGLSTATAALTVSAIALANSAGRVVAGFLSDYFGRVKTLALMLCVSIAAMALLALYTSEHGYLAFYVGVCLVGFCFGSFMGVFPGFTADTFGPKNNGVNYGIMFIAFAAASIAGPAIINFSTNTWGIYQPAFVFGIGLAAIGLMLCALYAAASRKSQTQTQRKRL